MLIYYNNVKFTITMFIIYYYYNYNLLPVWLLPVIKQLDKYIPVYPHLEIITFDKNNSINVH
jgi:hypothetical protein